MLTPSSIPDTFPPPWAAGWGEDAYGFFAVLTIGDVSMEFRWIPPGQFQMGSPEGDPNADPDEQPQHTVVLTHGFWMASTPCTQNQYRAVAHASPSHFKGDQLPVESVSWLDIQEFCKTLNQMVQDAGGSSLGLEFRLPTEAEWEYACRAGTTSDFNDGSTCTETSGSDPKLNSLGWYRENSGYQTHPVAGKKSNNWGLYDMHGNVWEWCMDGKRSYESKEEFDPVGPLSERAGRVLRGGSCWDNARDCRSAYRIGDAPVDLDQFIGFRLAAGQPVRERSPGV